ncbi:hypothetical protein Osc7112_0821 [Oscillatoria nigro-viridis PCC 7112]|uniref:Uncharacterized protein n=1 Tax=Phormidium nigroviride PCC 7112 TaxID=179408 RepID=K9VD20_9CYAN|nr:hypothetical protein [Oscillatoria nigro-viridis]AFZ05404.1 hypothetical protein Osc7112_0821 [Oscillatoria nigro-viridis PCC 7112]
MKFRVENFNGRTIAIFERELPPRSYLLAAFLEEARSTKGQIYLEIIEKIECSKNIRDVKVTELTGNCIDAELYTDRIVITELWPTGGEDAEPESTEILLTEAKRLLLEWQSILNLWCEQQAQ